MMANSQNALVLAVLCLYESDPRFAKTLNKALFNKKTTLKKKGVKKKAKKVPKITAKKRK